MKNYIGFDVHCKKIAYVIQDESGKVIRHGTIETTRQGIEEFIRDKEIGEGTKITLARLPHFSDQNVIKSNSYRFIQSL
jgi:hypothetical protein